VFFKRHLFRESLLTLRALELVGGHGALLGKRSPTNRQIRL
jgi:hypothetical protein